MTPKLAHPASRAVLVGCARGKMARGTEEVDVFYLSPSLVPRLSHSPMFKALSA